MAVAPDHAGVGAVARLLNYPARREEMGARATRLFREKAGVIERTLDLIEPVIFPSSREGTRRGGLAYNIGSGFARVARLVHKTRMNAFGPTRSAFECDSRKSRRISQAVIFSIFWS